MIQFGGCCESGDAFGFDAPDSLIMKLGADSAGIYQQLTYRAPPEIEKFLSSVCAQRVFSD